MKRCCSCDQMLPLASFHRNRRKRDGRQDQCIDCDRLRIKAVSRAMTELRQMYPAQYLELYEKHRAELSAEVAQKAAS
jgi:hypothetical protein